MHRTRCQALVSLAFKATTLRRQQFPSTSCFTYAYTSSIGFSSGAYGGKYTNDRRAWPATHACTALER